MPAVITTIHQQRVRRAKKIASDAIAHAEVVQANEAISRSTRTRAAYKYRSDALAKVLLVLSGKE